MRAYLVVTALLFILVAATHVARVISEFSHFTTDPWFAVEMVVVVILPGALSLWAWKLLRTPSRA